MIVMFKLTPAQKQIALSIAERLKHPLNQPEADQMDNYLFPVSYTHLTLPTSALV